MTTPNPWLERPRFRVDLEAISAVEYSCSAWYAKKNTRAGGVITFRGEYRYGSSGTDDARYIKWKIQEFCDVDDPRLNGLVIDFRELDYQWGNNLSIHGARRLLASDSPVLVVVAPHSLRAFAGVLDERLIRTDFYEALEEVEAFLKRH